MKSLSLLAEKYQEVQFSDPIKTVAACTPRQLLQAVAECSEGHDLKAIFNYVAESNENGNSLVTESLIEENTEVAATILAVEKILSYYVEAKDEKFNKEVKEALTRGKRANGQPTSTSANVNPANVQQGFPKPAPAPAQQVGIAGDPVNTPQAAAPQAGGAGHHPPGGIPAPRRRQLQRQASRGADDQQAARCRHPLGDADCGGAHRGHQPHPAR